MLLPSLSGLWLAVYEDKCDKLHSLLLDFVNISVLVNDKEK